MFNFSKYITKDSILKMKSKDVCVCGVNDFAIATKMWLSKNGINVIPVEECKDPFFVIADYKESSARVWEKKCKERFLNAQIIKLINPVEIRIEISGNCNLRCKSCQTANHNPKVFSHQGRGFMTPQIYESILDKVEQEYPDLVSVFFFICGEPFLNPYLKEILQITKSRGLLTVISSNLSLKVNWDKELLSLIDILKISVSGFCQEIYKTTHNGGDIELVKANMNLISDYKRKYNLQTNIFVGYHMYKNNKGLDMQYMKEFCNKLDFVFCPVDALYFNLFYASGSEPFPDDAREFIEEYYDEPEKILIPVKADKNKLEKPCRNRRDKLFIDWDGTVMLCEILHKEAFFKDYRTVSRAQIEEWREGHTICNLCRKYGLDYK